MKITKSQLNHIIKEELTKLLLESRQTHSLGYHDTLKDIVKKYHIEEDYGLSMRKSIRLLKRWNSDLRDVSDDSKSIVDQLGRRRAPSHVYLGPQQSRDPAEFDNPIAEYNAEKILEYVPMPGFYIRRGGRKPEKEEGPSTDWNRGMGAMKTMIDNFPLLQTNKIIKKLGEGAYGTAFLLDNDHVLKFFMSGGGGLRGELSTYEDLQQQQWAGSAAVDRPAIYDFGRIPKTKQYFVEMSQLISLKDWFKRTQRVLDHKLHHSIMKGHPIHKPLRLRRAEPGFLESLNKLIKTPNSNFKEELDTLFEERRSKFKQLGLTDEEINQYYDAILELINKHGSTRYYDVHLGNVGVLPQHSGAPDKFIIFDF